VCRSQRDRHLRASAAVSGSITSATPVVMYFKCTCLIMKLNPKQYWPNAQPADMCCVCLTRHWGQSTASHVTQSNVEVETGVSSHHPCVLGCGGQGREGEDTWACTGFKDRLAKYKQIASQPQRCFTSQVYLAETE